MMERSRCPSPAEVEQVFWTSRHERSLATPDAKLHAHVMACETCREAWDEIGQLAALGATIEPAPQWDRREEIRTTLLSKIDDLVVQRPLSIWQRWWIAPLACAAAVLVWWLILPSEPGVPDAPAVVAKQRAHVLDHPGARALVVAEPPDEIIRLVDGTLTVTVPALAATDRFRVIIGDDEVSATGAAFDITAEGDKLAAVRVMQGQVRIAASGTTETVQAGATWRATQVATNEPPAPVAEPAKPLVIPKPSAPREAIELASPRPRPVERAEPPPSPAVEPPPEIAPDAAIVATPPPRNLGQQAFDDAWSALRAGEYAKAATAFERAAVVTSDPQIVEDATFWRGVALARFGEVVAAARVLDGFVREFPRSTRAGEAHVILGWLLFERGDRADAKTHFDAAGNDPSSRVRARAREGLTAIAKKQ